MKTKCLMIETKDNRKFFTHSKNFKQLIEFSKNFGAKMFIVKTDISRSSILDLPKLAPALCNKSYKAKVPNFEIIETKLNKKKKIK
jgi:Holliday junction resolvase